jgi:hypothetical protein
MSSMQISAPRRMLLGDAHQHGIAQPPQRTASLYPIGGVQHLDLRIVIAVAHGGDQSAHFRRGKQFLQFAILAGADFPEFIAARNGGAHIFDAFFRQIAPAAAQGLRHDFMNRLDFFNAGALAMAVTERGRVADHHLLDHSGCGDAGQVGTARRRRQGQAQPDQIMHGIADHGLIEITDLDIHPSRQIGHGTQIADMAIAANPDRGAPRAKTCLPPSPATHRI